MSGMAEVSKSPRRLYSVVRNLEWAFPATFVLGIIAVPLWSADMYAGMTLSLTAVALAFGLLRPRRVEKSLGKWRIWLVSLLAPLAVLQVVLGLAALWHGSLVGGRTRTLAFQAEIADADRVVIRKGGGGCHGDPDKDDVLYVITNKTELAEFGKMFRFSGSSMPCACCGYPGVDWWKGNKRLVLSAIHHGHALGVKGFPGINLRLSSSSRLALSKWFKEHCGIDIENDGGWTDHRDDASPGEWQQEKFAANLYYEAASLAGEDENVVLSPWGVASLFAMLQTGARGYTSHGMARALQIGGEDIPAPDVVAATFRQMRESIVRSASDDVEVELSDSVWLRPGFDVRSDFLSICRNAFDAEVGTTEMGEAGRRAINGFVAERTHGRIAGLLSPPALDDPDTALVAIGTVYLKAKWQVPFMRSATYGQVFHAPTGDVETPFVHDTREAEILETPECSALRLPYSDSSLEMLVLLPSPSNTVKDIMYRFGGTLFDRLAENPWNGRVKIALPKFKFDVTHDLRKVLVPMGMGMAFSRDADFGGIADMRAPLYIRAAIQKTCIALDEDGTTASAATAVMVECAAVAEDTPPRQFVADRPFVFVVRDSCSGSILFLGDVQCP